VKRHDGFRPTLLAVISGENVWNASVHIIATTATSSKTIVRRLVVTRFIGKRLFHGSGMNLFSVTSGELEVLGLLDGRWNFRLSGVFGSNKNNVLRTT